MPSHARLVAPLTALLCFPLVACGEGDAEPEGGGQAAKPEVTFHEDIAPVLRDQCVSCHHDGGIGPFALTDYEGAAAAAPLLAAVTASRVMPPQVHDNSGDCQTYQDARWLTDDQIALFSAWDEAGAPEGDPAQAVDLTGVDIEHLDQADLTIDTGFDYTPTVAAGDEIRCFVVDPGLTTQKYVVATEAEPGNKQIVHHVILFGLRAEDDEAEALALDAADPAPGYRCDAGAGPGIQPMLLGGWAPGSSYQRVPEGTGVMVPVARKMVMQMHYSTAAGTGTDRTRMHLALADAVDKPAIAIPFLTGNLRPDGQDPEFLLEVEPGKEDASFEFSRTLSEYLAPISPIAIGDYQVHGVLAHMHTLGRTLRLTAEHDGEEVCLGNVKRWDWNWQGTDYYTSPVSLRGSDPLTIRCTYDTRGKKEPVWWGESTSEEMCVAFLYTTLGP